MKHFSIYLILRDDNCHELSAAGFAIIFYPLDCVTT